MSNDLVNSNKNPEVNAFNNGNFGNNTTIAIGEEITQNIDNRTTLFQITEAQTNINALKELINRTNELLVEDEEYRDFIHELNSLLEQRSGREIIGTEKKVIKWK